MGRPKKNKQVAPKKERTPLEKIKWGIQKSDWASVVAGYNAMTGEDLVYENTNAEYEDTIILNKIRDMLDRTSVPTEIPVPLEEEVEDLSLPDEEDLTVSKNTFKRIKDLPPNRAEPVKARKPNLVASHMMDKKSEKWAREHINPDKESREGYKPRITKCSDCESKFDFNKAYPGGRIDNGVKTVLCEKCQTKKM